MSADKACRYLAKYFPDFFKVFQLKTLISKLKSNDEKYVVVGHQEDLQECLRRLRQDVADLLRANINIVNEARGDALAPVVVMFAVDMIIAVPLLSQEIKNAKLASAPLPLLIKVLEMELKKILADSQPIKILAVDDDRLQTWEVNKLHTESKTTIGNLQSQPAASKVKILTRAMDEQFGTWYCLLSGGSTWVEDFLKKKIENPKVIVTGEAFDNPLAQIMEKYQEFDGTKICNEVKVLNDYFARLNGNDGTVTGGRFSTTEWLNKKSITLLIVADHTPLVVQCLTDDATKEHFVLSTVGEPLPAEYQGYEVTAVIPLLHWLMQQKEVATCLVSRETDQGRKLEACEGIGAVLKGPFLKWSE